MKEQYQRKLNVTITEEMEAQLLRYCTLHGIKKRDALRRAIALLLAGSRPAPTFDPERPL